ncbi:hypothetical protein CTI12_AA580690 [Artemisia annua]|uniref:Serine hydrolase domain-containing protein n=1 Tax=Artemisia annua TaxID=35608 RepID=A0A2U1KJP4_ARTAN|nr:hypothetical protein CTI12_AA580690 [Artemisia annua]
MKQGSILINLPISSNATPLVIPTSQIQFLHATNTFINYNNNIINHPYKSSSRFIHHKHKYNTTTMVEQQIVDQTNGSVEQIVTSNNNASVERKPRILCLHGFRTSGKIFETQTKKWPETVLEKVEFIFPDAPFPCNGKSEVEGIFDPPYYEWFQFNKEFTDYENLDKCLEYIEELMIKQAPIDGLAGFSQGAILSAALPGLQAKGLALTKVPKIKCLIIVSGAKLKNETWAEKAYSSPIQCPSLHFLGTIFGLTMYSSIFTLLCV